MVSVRQGVRGVACVCVRVCACACPSQSNALHFSPSPPRSTPPFPTSAQEPPVVMTGTLIRYTQLVELLRPVLNPASVSCLAKLNDLCAGSPTRTLALVLALTLTPTLILILALP